MSVCVHPFALRSAAIVRLVLTIIFALHTSVPTLLNSAYGTCEASSEYLYFCSCLSFDLASCLDSDMCALIDRSTRLVERCSSLVLQALLAPFRRLPFTTLSRDSCLCTWCLTCLWTDVRIFLHLCILGTCRWDSIKDLSTWLVLPLQHDWNAHTSVCELPRVSAPSGSLTLVFALHDLRDFNHLVDELNLQDFSRLLHLLNHGNLCCVTTDTSRILPLCCACARHLPLPVHGIVVNCVDRLHLMHLHCSR